MKVFFKTLLLIIPFAIAALLMNGCKKDTIATKGSLSFSTDTLTFDTVFTTLGSTTRYFKVRNTLDQVIKISDIKLLQLQGTQFRIAVDGDTSREVKDVEIPANDSIYVFVEVTVNPNNANNPFVITDIIQFVTNGNTQQVVLEAMGQNAYYHINGKVRSGVDTTWTNDKPHIVVSKNGGLALFEIQAGGTLRLEPRTQIYMAAGGLITVDGALRVQAGLTWSDSVVFQGIRRESDYNDKPGQWLGITYSRTATVDLNHTIINESAIGLADEHILNVIAGSRITTSNIKTYSSSPTPTVTLDKCIIKNASTTELFALQTTLKATNCLFYNGGGNMVLVGVGGNYTFTNCTVANVYNRNIEHKNPSFFVTDFIQDIDKAGIGPVATNASITNTVIDGNLDNEVFLSTAPSQVTARFQYCAIRNNIDSFMTGQPDTLACLFNRSSRFKSNYYSNFMPDSLNSPLVGSGDPAQNGVPDLFDYTRSTPISIGAIQWHQ